MEDNVIKLIHHIKQLRSHLGPGGQYTICREDRKDMGLGEIILLGDTMEKIDSLIAIVGQDPQPEDGCCSTECSLLRYHKEKGTDWDRLRSYCVIDGNCHFEPLPDWRKGQDDIRPKTCPHF